MFVFSQAPSIRPGTSVTKKASGSIGKTRLTLRLGLPPPAILSARSREGAVTRVRYVKSPSRISTVTRIISCSPLPHRRSRGQPFGHEIRNRIPGDIDVAVMMFVYPLAHAQPDRGDGILHVHDAQHLKQGALGGELYFLSGYLHHLASSPKGLHLHEPLNNRGSAGCHPRRPANPRRVLLCTCSVTARFGGNT